MSKLNGKYADSSLLSMDEIRILIDSYLLSDLRYSVIRDCGIIDKDEIIEQRRRDDAINTSSTFSLARYAFMENFSRVHQIPYNSDIRQHIPAVINYLKASYPYCFFLNGSIKTKDMDSALIYYAKYCLKVSDDKLADVIPTLQSRVLDIVDVDYSISRNERERLFYVNGINGSSVDKYKHLSLYDTLCSLDDKNIGSFINWIVVNGAVDVPSRAFPNDTPVLYGEKNGLIVAEGNHRLFTIMALQKLRNKFLTFNDLGPLPAKGKILTYKKY